MESKSITIEVSESIGTVSGLILAPPAMKYLLVFAHGAGAGMTHAFMEELAQELGRSSIGTLRYNFPFIENRKKRPDVAPVAEKTTGAAMAKAYALFPEVSLFAAGKSFGGRMSSHYLSKTPVEFIRGIVFFGFPLHPAGEPAITRADHLAQVKVPMLFLQGTRDSLAELTLITQVCKSLSLATLATFEGADHSFKSGKKDFISELAGETAGWLSKTKAVKG